MASNKLVKTKMAKSTLDAGWSMLKTMLEYKSHQAGIVFEVGRKLFNPDLFVLRDGPASSRKVEQVCE